jgi:hypothetical protein
VPINISADQFQKQCEWVGLCRSWQINIKKANLPKDWNFLRALPSSAGVLLSALVWVLAIAKVI